VRGDNPGQPLDPGPAVAEVDVAGQGLNSSSSGRTSAGKPQLADRDSSMLGGSRGRLIGLMGVITIVAAFVAFANVGSALPLDTHEIYVARTAEEMLDRGNWLTPYLNDALRLKKPPLNYWLVMVANGVLEPDGIVSEFEARLPSVLAGIALVIMTMVIGLLLFERRAALLAGLLVASSGGFAAYTHSARPEMTYAALCTAGLLGFCLAEFSYGRDGGAWRAGLAAWSGWAAFGLALLAKGPQLPVVMILAWYVGAAAAGRLKASLMATRPWTGAVIAATIGAWWYIAIWATVPEAGDVWWGETVDRYRGSSESWWALLEPYYFYRTAVLVIPWVVFFVMALITPWYVQQHGTRPARRMWWLVVIGMAVLSLSFGRRWYYMLPLLAPLALLMSTAAIEMATNIAGLRKRPLWVTGVALHAVGIATFMVMAVVARESAGDHRAEVVVLVVLAVATLLLLVVRTSRERLGDIGGLAVVCLFAAIALGIAQQAGALHGTTRTERAVFGRAVEEHVGADDVLLGWRDAWLQEQYVLHRPIPITREATEIEARLDADQSVWVLVDIDDRPPTWSPGTRVEVVINLDYKETAGRLQLWRVERSAASEDDAGEREQSSEGSSFDTIERDGDRLNEPVIVKRHAIDADHAVIAVGLAERPTVVDDVPVVGTWAAHDTVMAGPGGDVGILLEDCPDTLPWSHDRVGDGIRDAVVGTGPSAFRPHEVVPTVADEHERPLHIACGRDLLEHLAVVEREESSIVVAQPCDVAVSPAAVDQVVAAVVVTEYELVDRLGAMMEAVDEWSADVIAIRPGRGIRDGDADPADLVVALDVVGGEEQEVVTVPLDRRRGPHGAVCPRNVVSSQDAIMLRPGDEIERGERIEMELAVVGGGVGREDPVGLVEHDTFRIGVPPGDDGIA
jgi:4-amino-4-deoxy-L-arabinose transferase-like glycosyltransferase